MDQAAAGAQQLDATLSPTVTASPSMIPTATAVVLTGPEFDYLGIRFHIDPAVASQLYPVTKEPYEIVAFKFAPEGYCHEVGCLSFFDKEQFAAAFSGFAGVIEVTENALSRGEVFAFPTVGAAVLLQSHYAFVPFQNGNGFRGVVMRGQDEFFVNNEAIVYDYRGVTADGRYYVEIMIPVDLPFLISSYDPYQNTNEYAVSVPVLPHDPEEVYILIGSYNAEMKLLIDDAANSEFTPDLTQLDALVQSLLVQPAE